MLNSVGITRREFLAVAGIATGGLFTLGHANAARAVAQTPHADMAALRKAMMDSLLGVALHRARVFTEVFRKHDAEPWIVRKAIALRAYFETVPLYLREHDGLAGSISETPGAMPVMVELGIGELDAYLSERPDRADYLKGRVPDDIREYWKNRNLWGRYRTEILGKPPVKSHDELPLVCPSYKFLANQGHLCPSYAELLRVGIGGLRRKVATHRKTETNADKLAFLAAAEHSLFGLSVWAQRYSEFLAAEGKQEMSRICAKIATQPPETFREALQLVWLAHQAVHIEGHGYSCTPDRLDQLLLPFYEADLKAGRLDNGAVVRLIENFTLKMFDNTFWGPEHHLTQGFVAGGSAPDGRDQTNRLSWLMIEGATNMALPEPLIWIRWHPKMDQKFFDFCLTRLQRTTCFPMIWSDKAVPAALMALGVSRKDAFDYVPVGCNEFAVPGRCYYNACAHAGYLPAIEAALTSGKGLQDQWKWQNVAPAADELKTFDQFAAAVGAYLRRQIEHSYAADMKMLKAQMQWGVTPLTSCFFHGCIERARDMAQGTKYNILSCGGASFPNAVDCLAAVREVVYEKQLVSLNDVATACAANFQGHDRLRAKLQAVAKHGNDDPQLDDIITTLQRLRDEPVQDICRDPRDGSKFGNSHVVRSFAVIHGRVTPATPDGLLAGAPLASSVAASAGCERSGPTAVLNSVCKLNSAKSWQSGYQVNIRFHAGMIADAGQREKLRAMLNVYFQNGGQELQINVVDSAALRAAQKNPDEYRDLVVRVAGFSEFFVNLTPDMQEEIIARTEHM